VTVETPTKPASAATSLQLPIPTTPPPLPANELAPTMMRVRKRNGSPEPVDLNKIVRAVGRCCVGLTRVDSLRVATKTISGLYDGATTKEVSNQEIHSFSQSVTAGHKHGLIADRLLQFVQANARKLNAAIDPSRSDLFEYFGLRTVYDRYLLKNPQTREVIETPQDFFLRVACALTETAKDAIELYRLFSSLEYLPSSTRARGTSSSAAASCWTRRRTIWRPSTRSTRTWRCSRSSREASGWRTIGCGRGAR
jgi:ribonucleoside-diphosphate reductase alpha chain